MSDMVCNDIVTQWIGIAVIAFFAFAVGWEYGHGAGVKRERRRRK
jgi:hypothetical protein